MSKAHDAMQKLVAAGKGPEARDLVRKSATIAARQYAEIRSDATLSDAGKRHRFAVAATQHGNALEAELERRARLVTTTDRDDAGQVLGTTGLRGDAASLTISMRDAADRVENITRHDELAALLKRATRTGDEVLARAIANKALDHEDAKLMNAFLEDRPQLDAAAQRLWNAKAAQTSGWSLTMELADMKPSELFGMNSDDIRAIADAEPGAEPATTGWSGFGGAA